MARWWLQGGLYGLRPGAAPCQTQLAPKRTHHRAQLSPSAKPVVSVKAYSRTGRKCQEEEGGERVTNSGDNTKMRGEGGGASWHSRYPLQPVQRAGADGYSQRNRPVETPCWSGGKV